MSSQAADTRSEWGLTAAVVATLVVVVAIAVHTAIQVDRIYRDRVASSRRGCERGNVLRTQVNALAAAHPTLRLPPIPLIDCQPK